MDAALDYVLQWVLSALCQNLVSTNFLASFFQLTAPLPKAHQPDRASAKAHINAAGDCVFTLPHLL